MVFTASAPLNKCSALAVEMKGVEAVGTAEQGVWILIVPWCHVCRCRGCTWGQAAVRVGDGGS